MDINEAVFLKLKSLLNPAENEDVTQVDYYKGEALVILQEKLEKTDAEIDAADFSKLEKQLVIEYTCYLLVENQVSANNTSSEVSNVDVKKVKADVVEKEYFQNKKILGASKVLDLHRKKVCDLASQLGIYLELCDDENCDSQQDTFVMPARYFKLR